MASQSANLQEDKIHPAHLQGIFLNQDILDQILLHTANFKGALSLLITLRLQKSPSLLATALTGSFGPEALTHPLAHSSWDTLKAVLHNLDTTTPKGQKTAAWNSHIYTICKLLIKKDRDSILIPICLYATRLQLIIPHTDYLLKQCCKFHAPLCLSYVLQNFNSWVISWRNIFGQSLLHLLTNSIRSTAANTLHCIHTLLRHSNISSLVTLGDTDGDTPVTNLISEIGDVHANYWGSLPVGSYHRNNRAIILSTLLGLCNYEYPVNQPTSLRPDTLLHYAVQQGLHEALTAFILIEGCDVNIPFSAAPNMANGNCHTLFA